MTGLPHLKMPHYIWMEEIWIGLVSQQPAVALNAKVLSLGPPPLKWDLAKCYV